MELNKKLICSKMFSICITETNVTYMSKKYFVINFQR